MILCFYLIFILFFRYVYGSQLTNNLIRTTFQDFTEYCYWCIVIVRFLRVKVVPRVQQLPWSVNFRGRNLRPSATIREDSNSSSSMALASFICYSSERSSLHANSLRVNDKFSSLSTYVSLHPTTILCNVIQQYFQSTFSRFEES